MTLGNFSTKYGTASNDTITGGDLQVVFGLAGDDILTAGVNASGGHSILAGGLGDDTYNIPVGKSAIILESGGTDTVVLPFSGYISSAYVETVDNRHLVIGDFATNSGVVILDWQKPANRVEKFKFTDVAVTYDQLVSQYTSYPSYNGNFAIQNTNPYSAHAGYLDPATGLTPTTFNSFIDDISALAVGLTPPSLSTSVKRDFNGDGQTDILLQNVNQGWSGIWEMNGTTPTKFTALPTTNGATIAGIGDFNGDGQTDILLQNVNQGWSGIWEMNGTTPTKFTALLTTNGASII